ncbi:MAG: ATP synthase F1 subunit delta [Pseudodesulfovibrio sp.]|uniref:ATP synthase subunit delta n=1 Tax=Pseudodesulfovibrio indicus TaxID=1716143 RepID=A0A140D9H7_9BACT|nr:ATP synthase F1 subunit delta [Pseudodesulfovibrio indicus]AMK09844.1 ATP synthase F0F1 subunit delta [Pseudodesulfovibrio indicus]TDT87478.1 ATP synthase F1 subcomplex delta subunit [Pseudodesulfovibrio indicus]
MIGNVVSRRYAKALFAVGAAKGEAEQAKYGEQLVAIAASIEAAPEATAFFKNPAFSAEEKKAVLNQLVEKASVEPMVKNFCDLLADRGRVEMLSAIASDYKAMIDAVSGVITGELITVSELNEDRKSAIKAKLEAQAGKKLELAFGTDESILGGIVLKVGDKVMDASLKAQLQILKENIKRGE